VLAGDGLGRTVSPSSAPAPTCSGRARQGAREEKAVRLGRRRRRAGFRERRPTQTHVGRISLRQMGLAVVTDGDSGSRRRG
jgi:hypothetical protein